ncbi:MAG: hypothetical protein PSX36_00075 [bacterium]|nr:hypothetical protein [bacterium]
MKTTATLETYFAMIEGIRYENENGGAYAYVQLLAYNREVLRLLRPIKSAERHVEAIEGINWLFNEYLAVKFTHRQKVIFENKLEDLKEIFKAIRFSLREIDKREQRGERRVHAQAA